MPLVGILMGSKNDAEHVAPTVEVLTQMGIEHEVMAISAHRTPEKVRQYVLTARDRGIEVMIAAAGGAAALPGVVAAYTTMPVIGIPLATSELKGVDALYAIVMMPPGIPVATVAVGAWGARNAGYLAAQILGLKHDKIRQAYESYRQGLQRG
ncbi:MAG: 5-(carboxyamino)imidazole ribonucleotide mutase [Dehalococcoidia bacterium]|nr:5-(carboxyamino)imidazole ribonucleotide mutase [Dehalococcoidia bacterium]